MINNLPWPGNPKTLKVRDARYSEKLEKFIVSPVVFRVVTLTLLKDSSRSCVQYKSINNIMRGRERGREGEREGGRRRVNKAA